MKETPVELVSQLYQNARCAFKSWSQYSLQERIEYLRILKNYLSENMEEIIQIITKDTGKVKTEALTADVMPVLSAIEYTIRQAPKALSPQKVRTPIVLMGKKSYIEYQPRGVVLVISPWNYPFQLAMVPVISALVSGNTVILKPSEVTPQVGECMEEVFRRAGFPPGVIQVVHGGKALGAALTAGKPDFIFFTGSVRTGQMIQAQAAKDLIPTVLELGGKDPMIVFADANLKRAVRGALWGAFTNCGQVCMSVERLYVERTIYPQFVQMLREEALTLKTGRDDDYADLGSMTFEGQLEIIKDHVSSAIEGGAQLETGRKPEEWSKEKRRFLDPMILTQVKQDMKVVQEESFGPILPIIPFDTEEEAIELANDSHFGLNASVWSSNLKKARRVASKLISGAVVINDVLITAANHALPFGGVKQSGLGSYHAESGLRIFCHERAIMVDKGRTDTEVHWFPYQGKYQLLYKLVISLYGKRRNWVQFIKSYIGLLKRS